MCLISFITINYNGLKDTCELIESLPRCTEYEIIVVDNASATDEATAIACRYPYVKIVRSQQNLGFAGGNNLGIKAAQGRYLFFINNDTVLKGSDEEKQASLQELTKILQSSDKIGLVCPKIRFAWGDNPIQFAGYTPLNKITMRNHSIGFGEDDRGQYNRPHPTPYAHGAAMMAKREAITRVGLMPECFFLYYEEIDWSEMFTRAGYEIWYSPACTIYHKESKSTGQNSPLRTYYITRNRLLFAKRNTDFFFYRWLTYCYLIALVAPRDMLLYAFRRQSALCKAICMGITDFMRFRTGFKDFRK